MAKVLLSERLLSERPLAGRRYEEGYLCGIEWASGAPDVELGEFLGCATARHATTITVRPEWLTLRSELDRFGFTPADGGPIQLDRSPFVLGFVESASFLWWDADGADDGYDD
jgi:hypothetical protein